MQDTGFVLFLGSSNKQNQPELSCRTSEINSETAFTGGPVTSSPEQPWVMGATSMGRSTSESLFLDS